MCGAEAKIYLMKWLNRDTVLKWRIKKLYRNSKIDKKLRVTRTKMEPKLMNEVKKYGVATPIIYDVIPEEYKIIMEYIKADTVKKILNNVSENIRKSICKEIGYSVAKMHNANIVHGDLTTSNMLVYKIVPQPKIYFIDFGLGEKIPDIEVKGVDFHVLIEAFKSAHSEIYYSLNYVIDAYIEKNGSNEVINKSYEIEKRGRYK